WPYLERGVDAARPVCVWFENVYGHLSLGFDQVTESLRSMGYAVEAGIYTAAEIGAPHKRARVFILGILADAKDYVRGLYERSWKPGYAAAHTGRTGKSMGHTDGQRWDDGLQESGEIKRDTERQLSLQQSGWNAVQCGTAGASEDVGDSYRNGPRADP